MTENFIDLSSTFQARRYTVLIRALHRTKHNRAKSVIEDLHSQGWNGLTKSELSMIQEHCQD